MFKPKKPILGTEFAGEIEVIGNKVSSFNVGDKVFGFDDSGFGSHAQYKTISEDKVLTTIPGNITYELAAASTEDAFYTSNFINKVDLKAGRNFWLTVQQGRLVQRQFNFLNILVLMLM
jgi:NADPH:quinone reductase-like Zn-dependent oxidoreductase